MFTINYWIKIYENSKNHQNKNEIILLKKNLRKISRMIISLIFSLFTKNEITVRGVNRSILPRLGGVTGEFYGVDQEWKFVIPILDEGNGRKTRPMFAAESTSEILPSDAGRGKRLGKINNRG